MILALLAALSMPVGAADITFHVCPGSVRVERSAQEPRWLLIYCGTDAKPKLTLTECPRPATVDTAPNGDKTIRCPGGGLPVIVRTG